MSVGRRVLMHKTGGRAQHSKPSEARLPTGPPGRETDGGAMRPPVTKMPTTNLILRIFFRIVRDIKSLFGIDSYLRNEDRSVLELIIFPYFLKKDEYKNVLFVGCHWYTRGYNKIFEKKKNFWTIEIKPSMKKYGAKQHIIDDLQNLSKHFKPGTLDLIFCNG